MIYYLDGEFVNASAALVPVSDLLILRGYGVFDFLRTYNGEPFHLDAHVDRLFRSAGYLELAMKWTREEVIEIVRQTLARNDYNEAYVRLVVTGGDALDGITPQDQPRLVVTVEEITPYPLSYYTEGVKIITVNESRYLPSAKSVNYIPAILALKQAKRQGAIEAIYTHSESHALEGTTTNLFAFYGDTLVTPIEGILPGITRNLVCDLARDIYRLEERSVTIDELYRADEVFITSSTKQIMPVTRVNDTTIGAGVPGDNTFNLIARFEEHTGVPIVLKT
jgi:branched-chain amino acid aminotransferase